MSSGRVVGAKEVKVVNDKVNIDKLQVGVVAGLSLSVDTKTDFPGALAAHIIRTSHFTRKYQVYRHFLWI